MIENQPLNVHIQTQFKRLKNLLSVLRDDGVDYDNLLLELMQLVLIKMADEDTTINSTLALDLNPNWAELTTLDGSKLIFGYRSLLTNLCEHQSNLISSIFANSTTQIQSSKSLKQIIMVLEDIDWAMVKQYGYGKIYQDLLQAHALQNRRFTHLPQPLVDCLVTLLNPQKGQSIYDPYAGTGQLLVAASEHINKSSSRLDYSTLHDTEFSGHEYSISQRRLALINCFLHNIGNLNVIPIEQPSDENGPRLATLKRKADVLLTVLKQPLMAVGLLQNRQHLNKCFFKPIYEALDRNASAAVIVSNNIYNLVSDDESEQLQHKCHIHTILRLPIGLIEPNEKFSVLFISPHKRSVEASSTWIYDLRTESTAIDESLFDGFIDCYGNREENNRRNTKHWLKYPVQTLKSLQKMVSVSAVTSRISTDKISSLIQDFGEDNMLPANVEVAFNAYEKAKETLEQTLLSALDHSRLKLTKIAKVNLPSKTPIEAKSAGKLKY